MDYNSRQTRQRYIHKDRLTNLCTPAHSYVCTQSPSMALWTIQMHFAMTCMHANLHKDTQTHTPNVVCVSRVSTGT